MVDVSGVPGTGKTATVRLVLRSLLQDVEFDWIEVNGMKVEDVSDVYRTMARSLDIPYRPSTLMRRLEERFAGPCDRPCVVVLDEIDALLGRRAQSLLYRLFEWPGHAPVCVIGIANTLDLTERCSARVASRLGSQRVNFAPYTYPQLLRIVASAVPDGKLTADAVEFCARRIGAVSGDARRAISLAGRAAGWEGQVGLREMEAIMQQAAVGVSAQMLQQCSVCERVVLVAAARAERGTVESVVQYSMQLLRSLSIPCSLRTVMQSICGLVECGVCSAPCLRLASPLSLSAVSREDVQNQFRGDPLISRFL